MADVRQVTGSAVPAELRERDQWLLWSSASDPPKKPLNADGYGASWNDPDEWLPYDEARDLVAGREEFDGVGFVISEDDPYLGLDLDGCLREPRSTETKDWVPSLDLFEPTYVEYSTSGTGLHPFVKADCLPNWWSNSHFTDAEHEGVEAYSEKFFIVTGDRFEAASDTISEVDVEEFLAEAYEAVNGGSPTRHDDMGPGESPSPAPTDSSGYDGPTTPTDGAPELDDIIDPAEYPTERRVSHPFHGSGTGANFKIKARREVAYCYRHDCTLRGVHLWAIREGILRCSEVDRRGELQGSTTWREIYDALRSDGWDIEEPGTPNETEPDPTPPTQDEARERCCETVHTAVREGENVLADALPSLGKSYASATAPAATGVPVTYLTHLDANREDAVRDAREAGLRVHKLPRAQEKCPVLSGRCDESEGWTELFNDQYDLGVRPKEIHERHTDSPCQDGQECPYLSALKFESEDYDVIVGSPIHAHMNRIVEGRAVVFDEDPMQALETVIGGVRAGDAVDAYLDTLDAISADTVGDLLDSREYPDRKARILEKIEGHGNGELREDWIARTNDARPEGPAIAYGVLAADDLGNGFERASLPDGSVFVRRKDTGGVTVRRKPDLSDAHAVIGLDGTPFPGQWQDLLGIGLEPDRAMSNPERKAYLTETLGNEYIQTTDHIKPYSSGNNVNVEEDTRLLRWIADRHGEKPALIAPLAVLRELVDDGDGPAAEYVSDTMHYGALKGSNDFGDMTLGVILGAPSVPDDEIQRQAALDGLAVEPDRSGGSRSFGVRGDRYLIHSRDHRVAQAALRFGRNEEAGGATVYAHTSAVPDWVPVEREEPPSEGELAAIEALAERGSASSGEIAEAAGLTNRHARSCLKELASEGVAERVGSGPATEYVHRSASES